MPVEHPESVQLGGCEQGLSEVRSRQLQGYREALGLPPKSPNEDGDGQKWMDEKIGNEEVEPVIDKGVLFLLCFSSTYKRPGLLTSSGARAGMW